MTLELVAQFTKRFDTGARIDADLRQPADRFSVTVLFGPSSCGKTTTLRCLAGLERPEQGQITFAGETWVDCARHINRTPQQRDIGFLFQEYALFPHLTVADNIAYGITGARLDRRKRVSAMLEHFQIAGLEDRYPHQVSGGQQQRIALARVLVRRPRLLLLDEPLSALDNPTREKLRPELRRLLAEFGIPVVLVTHDRIEAMALADHLIVLDQGKILQQGSVEEVFSRPADAVVAHIVGMSNVLPGRVLKREEGLATVAVGRAQLTTLAPDPLTVDVCVCIRAEDVVLLKGQANHISPRNCLPSTVRALIPEGPLVRVVLDADFALQALVTRSACRELDLREGEPVMALLKVPAIHLISRA